MGAGGAAVRKLAPMDYARAFHNSVVLPNGQVVLIGGQTRAAAFTDDRSVLAAELFDPGDRNLHRAAADERAAQLPQLALLLPDARVLSAGGGLCGAAAPPTIRTSQILTPHYLLNADGTPATRPVITAAPDAGGARHDDGGDAPTRRSPPSR